MQEIPSPGPRARDRIMLCLAAALGVYLMILLFCRYALPDYEITGLLERILGASARVVLYPALGGGMLLLMRKRLLAPAREIGQKWAIIILAASTLVSRLILMVLIKTPITSDYKMYFDMASEYGRTGFYNATDYIVVVAPNIVLYIVVMGEVFRIFGATVFVAQIMNLCLLTGSVIALYLLAREFLSPRVSFWTALLFVFSPSCLLLSLQVNTEPMGLCTYLWGALLIVRALRQTGERRAIRSALLGGLILCFSNSIRSSALIMLITLIVWGLFFRKKTAPGFGRHMLKCFCVAAAGYIALNAGIGVIRNEVFEGKQTGINFGWTLYEGMDPESGGGWTQENANALFDAVERYPTDEAQAVLLEKAIQRVEKFSPAQWARMFIKKGVNMWIYNDYAYSPLMVDSEESILHPSEYRAVISTTVNAAYLLWLAAMSVALVYHAFTQWRKPQDGTLAFLLLPMLFMLLWHSFGTSIPRYHYYALPFIPMIALYCVERSARGARS